MSQPRVSGSSWVRLLVILLGGFGLSYMGGTLVAMVLSGNFELRLRSTGGLLELLGVGTVAFGISTLRRDFGLPSTFSEVVGEIGKAIAAAGQKLRKIFGRAEPTRHVMGAGMGAFGAQLPSEQEEGSRPGPTPPSTTA